MSVVPVDVNDFMFAVLGLWVSSQDECDQNQTHVHVCLSFD